MRCNYLVVLYLCSSLGSRPCLYPFDFPLPFRAPMGEPDLPKVASASVAPLVSDLRCNTLPIRARRGNRSIVSVNHVSLRLGSSWLILSNSTTSGCSCLDARFVQRSVSLDTRSLISTFQTSGDQSLPSLEPLTVVITLLKERLDVSPCVLPLSTNAAF